MRARCCCGAIGLLVCGYALYFDLQAGAPHFLALYALAGFAVGVAGVVPALMVAAFPPAVRFSGLSFSYNVAYALFGGLTPPLIGLLVKQFGVLAPAHYVAFTALIGASVAVTLLACPAQQRDGDARTPVPARRTGSRSAARPA